jgi:hypothetical protein
VCEGRAVEKSSSFESKPLRVVAGSRDPEQRQRAMRVDIRISKQAMKVVLPTNQQIGPWQSRAAHILALAEKLRATGRHDPRLADEAEALLGSVNAHQAHLIDAIRNLPSEVAGSTRLQDTHRALCSVATVLENALKLLQNRAPA